MHTKERERKKNITTNTEVSKISYENKNECLRRNTIRVISWLVPEIKSNFMQRSKQVQNVKAENIGKKMFNTMKPTRKTRWKKNTARKQTEREKFPT